MAEEYDIGRAFAAIENELIASAMRNMKRHRMEENEYGMNWTMWQTEQLKSFEKYKAVNKKKYAGQFKDINNQIETLISQAHIRGGMDQEVAILAAIKKGFKPNKSLKNARAQAEFFKLNERKLEALIKATTDDVKRAETAVLRRVNDQYRKIIFNAQVYANSGAGTYKKAVDMATKDFLSAGINCIEYKNGSRHTISDYADMAVRTASKRAYLQGEGGKRQEWGISTVIMNKRGNPCPKCLPFVGKVFIDDVWSGGNKRDGPYPLLSAAIAKGLYHPRCKDSHTTYFEGISTPPDNKFTKQELAKIEAVNMVEARRQYAERQQKKCERLAEHSLDEENKRKYAKRAEEWAIAADPHNELIKSSIRFTDKIKADAYYRGSTEALWAKLKRTEKTALWKYTGTEYFGINKALRQGAISSQSEQIQGYINDMTNAIKKSTLKDNVVARRGVSRKGLAGLLNVDESMLDSDTISDLLGNSVTEKGFMSTGVAEGAGFSGINMEIYLPKETQAIYAEPFSAFGGTNTNGTWNGKQKGDFVGSEAELIIQRNSTFQVREIKKGENGSITDIVLILTDQN